MKTIKLNFLECIPTEIELDEDREADPCFDLSGIQTLHFYTKLSTYERFV